MREDTHFVANVTDALQFLGLNSLSAAVCP